VDEMTNRTCKFGSALALLALTAVASPAAAKTCAVRDGVVAEVASGAFSTSTTTVTLKSSYRAEFRWDLSDREAMGWMRIVDENGREIGWVPAGHEAIQCGTAD
jgi:hypothetical protein